MHQRFPRFLIESRFDCTDGPHNQAFSHLRLDMLKMIPGAGKLGKMNVDDRQIKWTDAIIKSMTPDERLYPEIINGSRRKRIATGSGRSVQEVNQLLKQFHQMQQMMKKIGNNKGRMNIPFGIK